MVTDFVLPDLLERAGERAVIVSRSLKTWGASESGLAEMITERVDQQTNPTIAFLARGIEGIYVRMTAKAATEDAARALLDAEDRELRSVLGELIFAVDDETMESEVLRLCEARGWSLGVAESLTGGFIGARIANVPGASRTFKGSLASYATEVKRELLGVTAESVVGEESAKQMAEGAQKLLGADVTVVGHRRRGPRRDGRPARRHGLVRGRDPGSSHRGDDRAPAGRPRAHPPVLDDLLAQPAPDAAARASVIPA